MYTITASYIFFSLQQHKKTYTCINIENRHVHYHKYFIMRIMYSFDIITIVVYIIVIDINISIYISSVCNTEHYCHLQFVFGEDMSKSEKNYMGGWVRAPRKIRNISSALFFNVISANFLIFDVVFHLSVFV